MVQWLIVHSVVAAMLAVVVAAANRCFRLAPAARHLLWLIVLIKLLTPPVLYWPWPLPGFGTAPAAPVLPLAEASSPPVPSPVGNAGTVVIDLPPQIDGGPAIDGSAPPAPTAPPLPMRQAAAPAFSWEWLAAAASWIWLAGAMVCALRQGWRILYWRRRLSRGGPAPQGLEAIVHDLAGPLGVRSPRIVVMPGPSSPMLWGFGAPLLIWPVGLEERLSAEGRRAVILHELAHLRRRDHWVGWLLLVGGCIWWWHPLFWWVRTRLAQEAELACDAQVVATAPDARRAYAEALLEVCQRLSSAAAVPALGAAGGRRDLERRLVMIMREAAPRRLSWAAMLGGCVLGLLAAPAWTLGENPPPVRTTPPAVSPATAPVPPGAVSAAAPGAIALPPVDPNVIKPTPSAATTPPGTGIGSFFILDRSEPPAADTADAAREKKLKELEGKIQELMKEMQQLRGQTPPTPSGTAPTPAEGLIDFLISSRVKAVDLPPMLHPVVPAAENPTEVITLTRVAYKLKPATAAALASFLKDNVKTDILETKTDGDNLVVTTTPEAQHAIGQFIGLIQGKTPGLSGPMLIPPGAIRYGLPPGTPQSGPDPVGK